MSTSDVPDLSGAASSKQWDACGLRSAESLGALVQQFPVPSPAQVPGSQEKLSTASDHLLAIRREIQRSVRTPISLDEVSVLSDLLGRVSDLLGADSITDALGRPVWGKEITDTGYRLLDTANEYCILAQHFYSDEVQAARARRPSDAAEAEIAAVANKAAELKLGVMRYLKKVGEALQNATPVK